ncbi:aminotransferase class I/II-fold pyridoxal phosphate-dependent enzyme [Pseudonocardia acaciae]|uniref:aminotransferase class I/II-fold pyridoxal phosphate-dependent enzyme n=1 Tax=Pseudonocardia acaciae TaxID=551276 RepID=UPI000AE20B71|nr:aminotransferase class I/II-fold pyridoxal phosphate-dependent enzyme [Pseudonocardia acaciae]
MDEKTTVRIAQAAENRSAAGIAAAVSRLIKSGELAAGSRLPTVRALARELGTSPTTVNEAWRSLVRIGAVRTNGRNGSFVADAHHRAGWPSRFWRIAGTAGEFALDLSAGVPDPALLPPMHEVLAGIRRGPQLSGYLDPPVLPALERIIRRSWQDVWDPECVTVVDGSLDAVDRVLTSVLRLGDRVLVENPTFPPFLDLLELIGARPVPVGIDAEGMCPRALRAALDSGAGPLPPEEPAVLLLQPRAHNPTGASMSHARALELASVLRSAAPSCTVVEDDHVGDIAVAGPVSLAMHLPHRTVTIRSFSKSHGPDLRLAAVAGPAELIEPVIARRNLGPAWSSRLLQQLLADMLADARCVRAVARAREVYIDRRQALACALADRGIPVLARDGFNVWVPVEHERDALVLLATQGIGAAPGRPFLVAPEGGDHLRITTAALRVEGAEEVADALVASASRRGGGLHR